MCEYASSPTHMCTLKKNFKLFFYILLNLATLRESFQLNVYTLWYTPLINDAHDALRLYTTISIFTLLPPFTSAHVLD